MAEKTNLPQVKSETNVIEGSLWMIGISLVLFFIPMLNGLIGGFVGGYRVGTPKKAMMSAFLPAVVVAVGLWLMLMAFGLPVAGFFTGITVAMLIVLSEVGLFVGAFIGGMAGEQKTFLRQHSAPT